MIRDLDRWLTPVAERLGIGLINASPLHMGLLTEQGAPEWHPAPQSVKEVSAQVVELCKAHGAEPATVALGFCLSHPSVSSTLVGMTSVGQVRQNLRALDAQPDPALLAQIEAVIAPVRDATWASGRKENSDV